MISRRIPTYPHRSAAVGGRRLPRLVCLALILLTAAFSLSCAKNEVAAPEQLIIQTTPPPRQEFRWSNGKAPKSFDPALAAAAPETDVVRALFEGLTDIDGKTLNEIPAAAERWTSSEDYRTWTFYLRADARWSNGQPVTADDFLRSWTRAARSIKNGPNADLFSNIVGFGADASEARSSDKDPKTGDANPASPAAPPAPADHESGRFQLAIPQPQQPVLPLPPPADKKGAGRAAEELGVYVDAPNVLRVQLRSPDRDFAKLVASPVFRPVPANFIDGQPDAVTNGPFRVSSVAADGLVIVRSDTFWNRASVALERVRFVPSENAETALAAYRAGDLDAVTNVDFEPLALKLLTPYDDFRQVTHSALNFYEINIARPPFDDRRVRRALAMAIEREALTEGELQGSTRPALSFLPFGSGPLPEIQQDRDRARLLLEEAGFPDGLNFPTVRLVVNRNDMQLRIARLVAKMWKQNLNITAEIVVKSAAEIDAARAAGDFDIIRRGVVFASNDERASLASIFTPADLAKTGKTGAAESSPRADVGAAADSTSKAAASGPSDDARPSLPAPPQQQQQQQTPAEVVDQTAAVAEMRAIPLYFPTSYLLVKPYVKGFDINVLDAPSLQTVTIDNAWQPNQQ